MPRFLIVLFALVGFAILIVAGYAVIKTLPHQEKLQTQDATAQKPTAPIVGINDPIVGNPKAPVTIVEFSDFECPHCADAAQTMRQLVVKYPDRVRVVWKDMPNTRLHFRAMGAHRAARCAYDQNKFWEFHDLLFANQEKLAPEQYVQWADDLRMDANRFQQCLASGRGNDSIQSDRREGAGLGVDATPYFFIGATRLSGAASLEEFEKMIK